MATRPDFIDYIREQADLGDRLAARDRQSAGGGSRNATALPRVLTSLAPETKMQPLRLEPAMPTTLTLKNIPDDVYARLRAQATLNRRSLNSEAIVCLETILNLRPADTRERLVRLRAMRAALGEARFATGDIDGFKREGRE